MTASSYVIIRHINGNEYEVAKTASNGTPNIVYRAFYNGRNRTFKLYPKRICYVGTDDICDPHTVPESMVLTS